MDKVIKLMKDKYMTVATKEEVAKDGYISSIGLYKPIALRWCAKNGYKLGGYLGNWTWDAVKRS